MWWRELARICDGDGSIVGSWFSNNALIIFGNGASILFWLDRWCGDVPLRDRYRLLYDLFEYKLSTVAQMFARGGGEGGEAWKCRKRLWVWEEEMVVECRNLLLTVDLRVDFVNVSQ